MGGCWPGCRDPRAVQRRRSRRDGPPGIAATISVVSPTPPSPSPVSRTAARTAKPGRSDWRSPRSGDRRRSGRRRRDTRRRDRRRSHHGAGQLIADTCRRRILPPPHVLTSTERLLIARTLLARSQSDHRSVRRMSPSTTSFSLFVASPARERRSSMILRSIHTSSCRRRQGFFRMPLQSSMPSVRGYWSLSQSLFSSSLACCFRSCLVIRY
jgi:hypothetical protein